MSVPKMSGVPQQTNHQKRATTQGMDQRARQPMTDGSAPIRGWRHAPPARGGVTPGQQTQQEEEAQPSDHQAKRLIVKQHWASCRSHRDPLRSALMPSAVAAERRTIIPCDTACAARATLTCAPDARWVCCRAARLPLTSAAVSAQPRRLATSTSLHEQHCAIGEKPCQSPVAGSAQVTSRF
jgi:hypothetical protein